MNSPVSPARPSASTLATHLLAVTLLSALALYTMVAARPSASAPVSDARIYVQLALGLSEFGAFGRYRNAEHAPTAAMDVAPLYPWFVAQLMASDPDLRESLRCAMIRRPSNASPCPQSFQRLVHSQTALLVITLVLVWATAWVWTARPRSAWLAWLMALVSGILPEFAPVYLTEALTLPLGGLLTLALALLLKRRHAALAATVGGFTLGLLALTRPSFWYLLLAIASVSLMLALLPRWRRYSLPLVVVWVTGTLVTAPWSMRNHAAFDRYALSGGDYGGRSLTQRLAYNDMTLPEFGAAFVYWLPDWGDSLAKTLLQPASYTRLGWGDSNGFYRQGVARMRADMRAGRVHSKVSTLLRDEVLAHPIKHARATLALAWRGIFIGKTWGLVAWLCAAVVLWCGWRTHDYDYLLLCLPAWFLCLFQAAVSVSIPRYNLLLLPPLAVAMALQLEPALRRRRPGRQA